MGTVARLHGSLQVTVFEARNLPNADSLGKLGRAGRLMGKVASLLTKDVSDPYVTLQVGSIRVLRTSTVLNSLNPTWNETFDVDVAADTERVELYVKDEDEVGADTLGVVRLAAAHVAAGQVFDGWFDLADTSGQVSGKQGSLRLRLAYVPLRPAGQGAGASSGHLGEVATMEVPRSYFPLRHGCVVQLYQDACVPPSTLPYERDPERGTPPHAGPDDTHGCFEDIQAAIVRAQAIVYIAGWSVWPHVRLVRRNYPHPPYKHVGGFVPAPGTGAATHPASDMGAPPAGPAPARPVQVHMYPTPSPSSWYPPPAPPSYSSTSPTQGPPLYPSEGPPHGLHTLGVPSLAGLSLEDHGAPAPVTQAALGRAPSIDAAYGTHTYPPTGYEQPAPSTVPPPPPSILLHPAPVILSTPSWYPPPYGGPPPPPPPPPPPAPPPEPSWPAPGLHHRTVSTPLLSYPSLPTGGQGGGAFGSTPAFNSMAPLPPYGGHVSGPGGPGQLLQRATSDSGGFFILPPGRPSNASLPPHPLPRMAPGSNVQQQQHQHAWQGAGAQPEGLPGLAPAASAPVEPAPEWLLPHLTLGELLKLKSSQGVRVLIMVWDDISSNALNPQGLMGTHDEALKAYFEGTGVSVVLAPRTAHRSHANLLKSQYLGGLFTHHQKTVVVDAPVEWEPLRHPGCHHQGALRLSPELEAKRASDAEAHAHGRQCMGTRRLVSFVGGLDLSGGRWDTPTHSLFRSLGTHHFADFRNKCASVRVHAGPRQPWHDIHSRVEGPAAHDVLANFVERWHQQARDKVALLLDPLPPFFLSPAQEAELVWARASASCPTPAICQGRPGAPAPCRPFSVQVFRSIDSASAKFLFAAACEEGGLGLEAGLHGWVGDPASASYHSAPSADAAAATAGSFASSHSSHAGILSGLHSTGRMLAQLPHKLHAGASPSRHHLGKRKGLQMDRSIANAYVHHIRRSTSFVYIENQYFLGSCHMWSEHKECKASNLVPVEIAFQIASHILRGERYAAYVLVPMFPDGAAPSQAVQAVLLWQKMTIEFMYREVAAALRHVCRLGQEHPRDYLNFYCVGNRETAEGSTADPGAMLETKDEVVLSKSRRFPIYVHSKMMIVDDDYIILGSANINQRSLDGMRDTEIAIGAYQPPEGEAMLSQHATRRGDVYAFRRSLWLEHLGCWRPEFEHPDSLECVRLVNQLARDNWQRYMDPHRVTDMDGHLLPYPIMVEMDGSIKVLDGCDNFPDTQGSVMGHTTQLPHLLTT